MKNPNHPGIDLRAFRSLRTTYGLLLSASLRSPVLKVSAFLLSLLLGGQSAQAQIIYWKPSGASVTWATASNWWTTQAGTTSPVSAPGASDIAGFDQTSYAFQPTATSGLSLGGISIGGVSNPTAALTITTSTNANRIKLGSSGIIMNANSGTVNVGTVAGTTQGILLAANQNWTNNSSSLLTVSSLGNTDTGAYTVTLNGSGAGGTTITNVIADGATPGNTTALKINTTGGVTTLSGANTFTGGLTIQSGTVKLNNTTGAGAGLVTLGVASDATSGMLDLNGASRTINSLATAGTAANQIITNSAGTTATLNYTGAGNSTFGGVIQNGSGGNFTSVTLNNAAATLTLTGNNTYTGITTITAGTLSVNSIGNGNATSAIGASSSNGTNINLNGGTLQYTGGNTTTDRGFKISASSTINTANNLTMGNIDNGSGGTGTGILTKAGAGTLTVNDLRASSVVNSGTLVINGTNSSSATVTVNGATAAFDVEGSTRILGGITLDGGGSIFSNNGFGINMSGGGLIDVRSGSISVGIGVNGGIPNLTKTTSGTVTLSGNNSYTGVTTISGGVLSVNTIANGGSNSAIGKSSNASTNLIFDGGTLQYTGGNTTSDRAFTINAGKTAIIDTANNISLVGANGTATDGSLTKLGAGTLTLTGNNTNTGTTRVSAGTLLATGATSLTTSGTLIVDGGSAASAKLSIGSAADFTSKTVNITTAVGGVYQKDLATSEAYTKYGAAKSSFTGGNADTTASLLAGTTSGTKSVVTSFSSTPQSPASNDGARVSDVFSLTGTGSDTIVLQLSLGTGSVVTATSFLGYYSGGQWINAVLGNTGGTNTDQGDVAWNASFGLGSYGRDVTNGNVWAVINHNSDFAIVPEPSTWALLAFSLTTVMVLRRRRRA